MGTLFNEQNHSDNRIPARKFEPESGFSVTTNARVERLAAGSDSVRTIESQMGSILDRPVREQTQCTTATFCQLESRSGSDIRRCDVSELVEGAAVRIPAIQSDKQMSSENVARSSGTDPDNAGLGIPAVVCADPSLSSGASDSPATSGSSASIPARGHTSIIREQIAALSSMAAVRECRGAENISEAAQKFVVGARKPGTRAAYGHAWKGWTSWCEQQRLDPFSAPVERIVDYLAELAGQGKSYSSINGIRSAISAYHNGVNGVDAGQHPLISKVMTGIWNSNPPQPKYQGTWDVDIVLRYIASLGHNDALSDKVLTHKLATLLALTTSSRVSELALLNLENMADKGDEIVFALPAVTKTSRRGSKPINVPIKQFENDRKLCPVTCVRYYIRRTASWRFTKDQHVLFLSTIGAHKPVKPSTISGWMVCMMKASGIDTEVFKAHSTRGASTTKAFVEGLSLSDILTRANWSNAGTFKRFYCRDGAVIQTKPFETVVLTLR